MFKPLARVLGNKQNNNKTQKIQPEPNQPTKKTPEGRVKTAMIVKVDLPVEIKNSEQH